MAYRRGNMLFGFALGMSLALHVGFLLTAPNPAAAVAAERRVVVPVKLITSAPPAPPATQPEEPSPQPKEEEEIALGLDRPAPPSPTWLGFAEYLKQLAEKAPVDQAAFTNQPIAAAPPPAPPTPPTTPSPPIQASAQNVAVPPADIDADDRPAPADSPAPDENVPAADARSPDEAPVEHEESPTQREGRDEPSPSLTPQPESPEARSETDATIALQPESREGIADVQPDRDEPQPEAEPSPASRFIETLTKLAAEAREAAERLAQTRSADQTPPQTQPQAAPQPVTPPPTQPLPAIARVPTAGAPNVGARSDRESDPTSVIEVPRDQWQLGKPLAAEGLEVKPRRPEMTILTTLTAWPRNPICRISFDSTGVPKRAVIVQSTGDSRVDAAIEASLYRWRASGRRLASLGVDETINLTLRLVINPDRSREDTDSRR